MNDEPLKLVTPMKRQRGRPPGKKRLHAISANRAQRMAITRDQIARGAAPPVVLGSKPRYDLAEVQVLLGISLRTVRKRIAEGALAVVRDGARVFVTDQELSRYARGATR